MSSYVRFKENDDAYEPSSSDDEYDQNEQRLLDKYRNRKREESESETEVLGVGAESESDDDDQSEIALSDIDGQEDDNLPDVRAWGKEKKKYYGADYVDPDYGGFQEKDAHAAEIEEEEAKTLQSQLVQQLDDGDFSLDIMFKKKDKEDVKDQREELIKTDLSNLSNKQKLQILQKESPEFFGLVDDFKVKMTLAKDFLRPIVQKFKNGEIEDCKAVQFVQTYYELILSYATNIHMYLILKANKELKNHPVIQRLYQYRQLLAQMEPGFNEIIKPQIEFLLSETTEETIGDKTDISLKPTKKKKKVLQLIAQIENEKQNKKTKTISDSIQPSKKMKLDKSIQKPKKVTFQEDDSDDNTDMDVDHNENNVDQEVKENEQESTEIEKRAITYQIAKNKGLTPHRKKELRNPRVKHRLKFRKALIRRKGAVREPRKELKRYSGEISGIKTSVSKSIKIKT